MYCVVCSGIIIIIKTALALTATFAVRSIAQRLPVANFNVTSGHANVCIAYSEQVRTNTQLQPTASYNGSHTIVIQTLYTVRHQVQKIQYACGVYTGSMGTRKVKIINEKKPVFDLWPKHNFDSASLFHSLLNVFKWTPNVVNEYRLWVTRTQSKTCSARFIINNAPCLVWKRLEGASERARVVRKRTQLVASFGWKRGERENVFEKKKKNWIWAGKRYGYLLYGRATKIVELKWNVCVCVHVSMVRPHHTDYAHIARHHNSVPCI